MSTVAEVRLWGSSIGLMTARSSTCSRWARSRTLTSTTRSPMSTELISFEYPTVCVTHVRGTECLPGVSYVLQFPP